MLKAIDLHLNTVQFPLKFAAQGKTTDLLRFLHEYARKHISNSVCGQTCRQEPTDALDSLYSFDRVFAIAISEPEGFQQSPLFVVPQGTSAGIRASRQFTDLHVSRMLDIDASVNVYTWLKEEILCQKIK